jgi:FKBP12-rapamycin complex-associated protein
MIPILINQISGQKTRANPQQGSRQQIQPLSGESQSNAFSKFNFCFETLRMEGVILDLKNKSDDVRSRAADDFRDLVMNTFQENSPENVAKFMNDIYRRLFDMLNSPDPNEKLGAIAAIDKLISLDNEENSLKISRFSNYLRMVLPSNDFTVMSKAAKTMGRLALFTGTVAAEFVEYEVRRCLEWLDRKIII